MVINKIKFPLYGIIIVLAVFIGMWYIYRNLEKEKCKKNEIYLYFIMYIPFAFIFGKIYTVFALLVVSNGKFLNTIICYGRRGGKKKKRVSTLLLPRTWADT